MHHHVQLPKYFVKELAKVLRKIKKAVLPQQGGDGGSQGFSNKKEGKMGVGAELVDLSNRHHDESNPYKRKHLIRGLLTFSVCECISIMAEADRHGIGAEAERLTS